MVFKRFLIIGCLCMALQYAGTLTAQGAEAVGLTPAEAAWLKKHPVITLGGGIFPPLDFVDEAGKTTGVGPDYADRLAKMLGIRFKYVSGEWADILDMVQRKEIDGIRLVTGSEARHRALNLTEPVATLEYGLFLPKGAEPATSLDAMAWKRVAVLRGAYCERYIARYYPDVLRRPVDSYREGLNAVMHDYADGVVGMLAGVTHVMGLNFKRRFNRAVVLPEMSEELRMGIRKDWPELTAILDKALAALPGEDRQAIHSQWLVEDMAEEVHGGELTLAETRWLAEHRAIRFGMASAWAPYEFLDETGKHSGVVSDIATVVNREIGQPLKPVYGLTRAQRLEKLKAGEVDVILAMAKSEAREDACLFTAPYLTFPLGVITRDDFRYVVDVTWMEDVRVAVVTGSVVHEYLERDHPGLAFVLCADMREALAAVSEGEADVLVGSYAAAEYARRKLGFPNLRVTAPTPYSYEISMAVRSDWPELVHILDKKLAEISEFDKLLMLERWMTFEDAPQEKGSVEVPLVLWVILFIALILDVVLRFIMGKSRQAGK